MGFFSMSLENAQIWENIANPIVWQKHIQKTNNLIGKQICIELDNIYSQGTGAASFQLKGGGSSLLVIKPKISSVQEWWMPKSLDPESEWLFLISADQDTRMDIGEKLSVNFPDTLVPLKAMEKELWWFPQGNAGLSGMFGETPIMQTQKIVDSIIIKNYSTLIGRICEEG
jgi:hypothetical protein